MFSWTSLTRFRHSFHQVRSTRALAGVRAFFSQSQPSTLSSSISTSTGGFKDGDKTDFDKFLKFVSGLAVVGYTLGFWYFSNSSAEDSNAFADHAKDGDKQNEPHNNSSFLFNGNIFTFLRSFQDICRVS